MTSKHSDYNSLNYFDLSVNYNTELDGAVQSFDIRNFTDQLAPNPREKGKYICPACNGNDLSINQKTGKFNCWNCGDTKAITRELTKIERTEKAPRQKKTTYFKYPDRQGNPLIRVVRNDDGCGKKRIFQQHWDGQKWVKGYGAVKTTDIPLYRYAEVKSAIANGQPIVLAEGEGVVDAFWEKGIAATTTIGGTGKTVIKDKDGNVRRNDETLLTIKPALEDLINASVILAPDQDKPGCLHMEMMAEILSVKGWLYALPDSFQWSYLPDKGGIDFVDWIHDYPKLTAEDILKEVKPEPIHVLHQHPKIIRHPSAPNLSVEELTRTLKNLIETNPTAVQINEILPGLAKLAGWTDQQIWRLYKEIEKELEKDSEWAESKNKADKFRQIRKTSLTFSNDWAGLNPELARAFKLRAQALGVSESAVMTALYPVAASLIPCHSQLLLIKATDGYAKPIIYAGLNAKSAGLKSPTMKLVLNALFKLQSEANERYQQQLEEWAEECAEAEGRKPPKPIPKDFYTTDATSEAVAKIQADNIHSGFLGWFDELMGLIKSANAYRSGRGADAEKLLSGKDGTGIKVDRVGKKLYAPISAYSILGGTQPDVLNAAMGDLSDSQGQWARFWWCYMPAKRRPFPNTPHVDITSMLYEVYKRLQCQMANTYELSNEAHKLFVDFYNELDELAYKETRQGLATVYGKWKFDVGVIALVQHCFSAASNNQEPGLYISADTMRCAINQARFYIDQVKFIHGDAETTLGDSQAGIIDKLTELSERIGWVKAADFRDNFKAFRNQYSPDDVRNLFQKLASDGIGVVQGSGARLQWCTTGEGSSPTANSGYSGQTQGQLRVTQGISDPTDVKGIEETNPKTQGQTQGQLRVDLNPYIPVNSAQKTKTQGSALHFSTQGGDFPETQGENEKPTLSTLSLDSKACNPYPDEDTTQGKNSGQATLSYPEYPEFCSTLSNPETPNTTHTDFEGLDSGVKVYTQRKTVELDIFDEELMQWMGVDQNDEIHLLQLGDEWQ